MKSRRAVLSSVRRPAEAHLGLWIDKFVEQQPEKGGKSDDDAKAARAKHLRDAADLAAPAAYRRAFERRQQLFEATPESASSILVTAEATAKGRLVVGLGEESVLEVGIHLDHTWGVPVIPGSALKGLAAAAAHQLVEDDAWRKGRDGERAGESFATLFGSTDEQGKVAFLDAWWKPVDGEKPVHLDVMTVHHADYYQGKKGATPSDTDSPNPVSFLSTTGTFALAVEGPPEWCQAALELLRHGLERLGVGAKTNGGYGRMTLEWKSAEDREREREAAREAEKKRQFDALPLTARLPLLHAERLSEPVPKQAEWLRAEGHLPQHGATELEWKAALKATYAAAIAHLREQATGKASALGDVRSQLEARRATKPKDKKSKDFKRWQKDIEKLESELKKAGNTDANREAEATAIRRWLGWLDGE